MEPKNFFEEIFHSANQLADILKHQDADTKNQGLDILTYQIDSVIDNVEIFLKEGIDYSKPLPVELNYIKIALKQLKTLRNAEKELEHEFGKALVVGPKMGEVINLNKVGGKRHKTRKMRGGVRAAGAASGANASNSNNENRPMTWRKPNNRAAAIDSIQKRAGELKVAKARTNAATRKIRREEVAEVASWSLRKILIGTVAALSAIIGIGTAQHAAETTAYTAAAIGDAFTEAKSKIPFLGLSGLPPSDSVIPTECMPLFLEGDAAYTAPPRVTVDTTVKYPWKGQTDSLGEIFAENVVKLLEHPTVIEWPMYQVELTAAFEASKKSIKSCEEGRTLYQSIRGIGCEKEAGVVDAKKLEYELALATGSQLGPSDLKYTSGDLTTTVSALGKGLAHALARKDLSSAKKVRELVSIFESTHCTGLSTGTGVLKPELMATIKGYSTARDTCSKALYSSLSLEEEATAGVGVGVEVEVGAESPRNTYDPVVRLLADTLRSANDVRVGFFRDNVMTINEQSETAEIFVRAGDARAQGGKMGINLLIKAFEIKKSRARAKALITDDDRSRGEISKEDFAQIIVNIRLVDLRGIKIPNDVSKVADYAETIENTYSSYIAAGRPVPMTSTHEFFRQKYAKAKGNTMIVTVMGGVGGLIISAFISMLAKFMMLGAISGPAVAAAAGQAALNLYTAQQNNATLQKIIFQIQREIAEGDLDANEGMIRILAITNGSAKDIRELMNVSRAVKNIGNTGSSDKRKARLATAAAPASAPRLSNVAASGAHVASAVPHALTNRNTGTEVGTVSRRRNRRAGGSRHK